MLTELVLQTAFLFALIMVNLVLMIMPYALVRFVFGVLTMGIFAVSLTITDLPFYGWFQLLGLMVAVLAMLFATRAKD